MCPAGKNKSFWGIKFSRVSTQVPGALNGTLAGKTAIIVQQVQWGWEAGAARSFNLLLLLHSSSETELVSKLGVSLDYNLSHLIQVTPSSSRYQFEICWYLGTAIVGPFNLSTSH